MRVEIIEWDKDYNCLSDKEILDFNSVEQAHQYCKDKSWGGYSYMVSRVIES
jgi:hypothetical protein